MSGNPNSAIQSLVEVLSPTTGAYDRGNKFRPSQTRLRLRDYLRIAQDRAAVDHYLRRPASGQWLLSNFESLDAIMSLPSFGIGLPRSELDAKVEFSAEEP